MQVLDDATLILIVLDAYTPHVYLSFDIIIFLIMILEEL